MPRPKTAAAEYERFPARLPKDVMYALRAISTKISAANQYGAGPRLASCPPIARQGGKASVRL